MSEKHKTISTIEERIATQQKKLVQLKAQKSRLEAIEKARNLKAARAADTRRKILLGAYLYEQMQRDESLNLDIQKRLDTWLKRPEDRGLFGLNRQTELQQTDQEIERKTIENRFSPSDGATHSAVN
jgi:hypothetical protein